MIAFGREILPLVRAREEKETTVSDGFAPPPAVSVHERSR
jgi:hypothetical protein